MLGRSIPGVDAAIEDGIREDAAIGDEIGEDAAIEDGIREDAAIGDEIGEDAAIEDGIGEDAAIGDGIGEDAAIEDGIGEDAAIGDGIGEDAAIEIGFVGGTFVVVVVVGPGTLPPPTMALLAQTVRGIVKVAVIGVSPQTVHTVEVVVKPGGTTVGLGGVGTPEPVEVMV